MKTNKLILILSVFLVALFPMFASATLTNGLVSYWYANETSGNLADVLGYNTLTAQNTPQYYNNGSCFANKCVVVNGTGSASANWNGFYTGVISNISDGGDWSLSIWATQKSFTAGYWNGISMAVDGSNYVTFQTKGVGTNTLDLIVNGANKGTITSYEALTNYVIISQESSGTDYVLVYVGGTLVLNTTASGTHVNTKLHLGGLVVGGGFSSGSVNVVDEIGLWNRVLTTTEINQLANLTSLASPIYPFTITASPTPSISFQGQTPANASTQYILTGNNFTVNTTVSNFNGTIITKHFLYNSTFGLIAQNNQTSGTSYASSFNVTTAGTYYFNATASNTTYNNITEIRTIYIYSLTTANITNPTNLSNISTRYQNFTWSNATINPTSSSARVQNFSISIHNLTGTILTSIGSTNQLNFSNYDIYNTNLAVGTYLIRVVSQDNFNNTVTTQNQFNLTRNTQVNITAVAAVTGVAINSFDGWLYQAETGLNITYSSTTGVSLVDFVRGNLTAFMNATGYSLSSNSTVVSFNNSLKQYDQIFRLYETNTLNITFFDQRTPTTLLTGLNITLDLISSLYSTTSYTTNGTMYLTLLTPESYTLRYSAPNYAERFYAVTVDNRSFQNIQLYMINGSATTNITIRIVNQVLNPIQGAVVKALKYNLATNTYILQEIDTTDVDGKVIMALTFNDEYYKFIVEYPSGTVSLITNPAYITSTDFTISINFGEDIIEEYSQFESIVYTLSFTPSTLNYRFDFTDVSNIASEYCLYVYKFNNGSQTLTNTSCSTGSSGTILAGVTNISGTVYLAKATYNQDGVEKFLTSLFYEFPSSMRLGTNYGLFLQLLLSIGFAAFFVLNLVVGLMAIPFSLILGKIIGLNVFSWAALLALQTAFIIIGVLMVRK